MEKIGYDFITEKGMPIGFYALPEVIEDINRMNLDCLKYYGDVLGCIVVNKTLHIEIDNFEIDLTNNNPGRNITFYVIKENEKKVIYACCNPKPVTHNDLYFDADILIISLVSDDGILNDGTELKDAPFKDEIWGKSYGYYRELEKELDNIFLPMTVWKL